MKRTLRVFSPEFKTKVALEALKERKTVPEQAQQFAISPMQITAWKKVFFDNASSAFEANATTSFAESKKRELNELLGQKETEIDLKKSLEESSTVEKRKQLLDSNEWIDFSRQCESLTLNRTTLYNKRKGESGQNLLIMNLIDRL